MRTAARDSLVSDGRAARRTRLSWIALASGLGALTAVAAVTSIARQSPFSEYLAQARRCVELNDCPSLGGRTGALPLFHGAVWNRLLSYSLRAGGDQTPVQDIILGSWLLSIPFAFFFLQRYAGLRGAALGLGLYFPVVLVGTDITNFTYTNLLPLPWVVYFAGMALLVEFRAIVFGAIASVALAAAVSAELGSIVMVPFHLLLPALACRRPAVAAAACGLAFAIPFSVESTDAAIEIARQVPTARFAVGLALSGGVIALAARFLPRSVFSADTAVTDRVHTVMTAALVYATVTMFVTCLLLMEAFPAPRYFLPASVPFLCLIAARMGALGVPATIAVAALESAALVLLPAAPHAMKVLQVAVLAVVTMYAAGTIVALVRRGRGASPARFLWAPIAICLCAIALAATDRVALAKRGAPQSFTMAEAERVVAKLYGGGHTYVGLLASLHGPAVDELMSLLAERDPDLFREPAPALRSGDGSSLLLLKVPNTAIARTEGIVAAVPVDDTTSAIAVKAERSYLDWLRMRRCEWVVDHERPTAYVCAGPRINRPLLHNWPYVEFGEPFTVPGARLPDRLPGFSTVRYEVPVRTPGRGVPHIVRTSNEWPASWRIVGVSGVDFEGPLPGPEIRLPDRLAATGLLELEFVAALPGDLPWVWRPNIVEVTQANEHLLDGLRFGQ